VMDGEYVAGDMGAVYWKACRVAGVGTRWT